MKKREKREKRLKEKIDTGLRKKMRPDTHIGRKKL
jgi:hypothetical protein